MNNQRQKLNYTAERLGLAPDHMPAHIAIIMDGNGRWAQRKGLPRNLGHKKGGKVVEKIALGCVDLGIESLTIYSFSSENWKRPQKEINALMDLYSHYLIHIRPMLKRNNVKLIHMGKLNRLPEKVLKALAETQEVTKDNAGMILAMALNYSGRQEITDAVRNIAQKHKEEKLDLEAIDEQCISNHLYCPDLPDPDLLIRTSNEMRISNFLLWQISYSEFYVTQTLWPDFKISDLEEAMVAYANRIRKFGSL